MTDPTHTDYRRIVLLCFYLYTALWGVVQVFTQNSAVYFLFAIMLASTATTWVVIDSRRAGHPLLHIVQFLVFITWPVALPIYLIWSRRLRGLGLILLHGVGLVITLCASFYTTLFVVYGSDVFARG